MVLLTDSTLRMCPRLKAKEASSWGAPRAYHTELRNWQVTTTSPAITYSTSKYYLKLLGRRKM
jgi:hypothetical protein